MNDVECLIDMLYPWSSWIPSFFLLTWRGSGSSHHIIYMPEGRVQRWQSQALFRDAQEQNNRQWASETQGLSSNHQEALLRCENGWALAQLAQIGCVFSLEVCRSHQDVVLGACTIWACLSRDWTRWTQSSLPISTVLWFCHHKHHLFY